MSVDSSTPFSELPDAQESQDNDTHGGAGPRGSPPAARGEAKAAGEGDGHAERSRSGSDAPKGPPRVSCSSCKARSILAAIALLSPVWLTLVLCWTVFGAVVTVQPGVLAAACWLITLVLFLWKGGLSSDLSKQFTAYSWDTSAADIVIVSLLAAATLFVTSRTFPKREGPSRLGAALVVVAYIVFAVLKSLDVTWAGGNTAQRLGDALIVFPAVWVTMLGIGAARLWRPVTMERLDAAEQQVLMETMSTPYVRRRIAGISTIEVSSDITDRVPPALVTTPARLSVAASPRRRRQRAAQEQLSPRQSQQPETHFGNHRRTLVLIHGFGAGNAFWALNLSPLAERYNVYAVDWRGVGASVREPFTAKTADQAEAWFVEGLERWRDAHPHEAHHLQHFTIVAHSLGAMIASAYTLRHPHRVDHLILASPCGVPDPPKMSNVGAFLSVVRWLWNQGITPNSLARWLGPFGPSFMRVVVRGRTSRMPSDSSINDGRMNKDDISAYLYQSWASPRSGENALSTLLLPGAFAVNPLNRKFVDRKTGRLHPSLVNVAVSFIYGGRSDWMDERHGAKLAQAMKDAGKADVDVRKVHRGGHQLFLNRTEQFNATVLELLELYETRQRQQALGRSPSAVQLLVRNGSGKAQRGRRRPSLSQD